MPIYPKGDERAFAQVEKLREDDRIDMFAEADYSEGTTAYMWICNKVREFADNIKKQEQGQGSGNYSIRTHLV